MFVHYLPILLALLLGALICLRPAFREGLADFIQRHIIIFSLGLLAILLAIYFVGMPGLIAKFPLAMQIGIQLLTAVGFMFIQFGAMMYFMSRARVYWVMPGESPIMFEDYKGNPEVLERAQEVVQILKSVKDPKVRKMGINAIPGLLLEGDPGVGKSYLGQAIAGEAGVPFGYASSPSLQQAFMGMSAMTIWRLYKKAGKFCDNPKYGACILFLDEIDAVAQNRSGQSGGGMMGGMGGMMGGGGSQILNEILTQMDPPPTTRGTTKLTNGIRSIFGRKPKKATRPNILTIGATNLVHTLDPAILRPGRFEQRITVDMPSEEGRKEIFDYYLSKSAHALTTADVQRLVRRTQGYSPVAIKKIINQGLINALRCGRDQAKLEDIMLAQNVHEFGAPQPIKSMSMAEKERIAFHEAGHAVAAVLLQKRTKVEIATIIRRGGALGLVGYKPISDMYTQTKDDLLELLDICLASRATEELCGIQMTGFSGDLQTATQTVLSMVGAVGMGSDLFSYAAVGMATAGPVVEQAKKLTQLRFRLVKEFISRNMTAVEVLAAALIEQGDIDGPEVIQIVREHADFMPEEELHVALGYLLNEEEKARFASVFSDKLVEIDSHVKIEDAQDRKPAKL